MAIAWDQLFVATNAIAAAGWLALALLPRTDRVMNAVLVAAVGLLCGIYLVLFTGLMGGIVDPGRGGGAAPPFEYTVEGLQAAFAARGVMVLGWTHYLAFDLFVGLWIARDADKRRVGRLAQLPFFLASFLAGPIGLLAWLLARGRLARR